MRARICVFALGALLVALPASAEDPFLRRTATVRVVEKVGPAVVNITTERVVSHRSPFRRFTGDPFFDRFFRDFFEPRSPQTVKNLGSGVIIDARGHVLTNEHVIARASRIRVTLADGREFDAEVIGADANNDLAVLRIDTEQSLPWTAPGQSEELWVGEPVIAIGNPFGLSNTVTTGVVSALDRSIRTEHYVYHGFLQTDASINPGNSGGPLLNAEGKLIAINTAVYGGAQGIGFAIPIDTAKRIVSELIAHGEVAPVWLGLSFQDLTPPLREALGLPEGLSGTLVNRVRKASPGERAGVQRGDVITRLQERPVETARGFFEMLRTSTTGQSLRLRVWRDGATHTVTAVAAEIPPELIDQLALDLIGVRLEPGGTGGFRVTSVRQGSGAAQIGIQRGDLILGINGQGLTDPDALRRSILDLRGRARALVVVQRGPGRYHVTIPLA